MKKNSIKTGATVGDIILIVFIVLKLMGIISWSWIWVFSPLWIGAIIFVLSFIAVIFINKRMG